MTTTQHQNTLIKHLVFILLAFIIVSSNSLYSQAYVPPVIKKSEEKVKIEGKVFYLHKVKQGETIFSLCKVYEVSEGELKKLNPQLTDGLKTGQTLKIPEKPQPIVTVQAQPIAQNNENKVNNAATVTPQQNNNTPVTTTNQPPVQQTVQQPQVKERIEKIDFTIYTATSKQSLRSIAREFNVDVDDIKKHNPDVKRRLSPGDQIKIPRKVIVEITKPEQITEPEKDNVIHHEVKKGDTKYSLTREYNISEEELQALNPNSFKEGVLQLGTVLQIPVRKAEGIEDENQPFNPALGYNWTSTTTTETDEVLPGYCSQYNYEENKEVFNVALILPFSGKASSPNYIQFYEGALLALNMLKDEGFSVNFSVFDISENTQLDKLINSGSLNSMHLIIGPVYTERLKIISEFARNKKIPLVSPLDPMSQALVDSNPYFYQISPPEMVLQQRILSAVPTNEKHKVILALPSEIDSTLLRNYELFLTTNQIHYVKYDYMMGKRPEVAGASLKGVLDPEADNRVLIVSEDEAFVQDLLANLSILTTTGRNKYNITVFGTPAWRKFSDNIDVSYYYNLKMRIAQPIHVNYNDDEVKDFVYEFRYYYRDEPNAYAFQGYDVCYYFLNALRTFGPQFEYCLSFNKPKLLQSNFIFRKTHNNSGYFNVGSFLLEYRPDMYIDEKK